MPKSAERCREIREEMKRKIMHDSMLFFARNGFSGTKISDLAKHIGIAQGTIYVYFKSKEELFYEISAVLNNCGEINELKVLANLPISAHSKINKMSERVIESLEEEVYAAKVAWNTQLMFETNAFVSEQTTYQSDVYHITKKIIEQGQKEGSVVAGSSLKLADYYWGVVYLYALKRLFTKQYEMITKEDLSRLLLKDVKNGEGKR